jgi:hypothetical protein
MIRALRIFLFSFLKDSLDSDPADSSVSQIISVFSFSSNSCETGFSEIKTNMKNSSIVLIIGILI